MGTGGLSDLVLQPQWPHIEDVSVSAQLHQATVFVPRSVKPQAQNAGKAATQQEKFSDFRWDCSAPGGIWAIGGVRVCDNINLCMN